jgi:hypothetical protein
MIYYYNYARTALKIGLIYLNIKPNDTILIPEYICEAFIQPINDLGIKIKYFQLDNELNPIWKNIIDLTDSNVKCIVMLNYFGIKQNSFDFKKYCKSYNIYLIEDNAHTYFCNTLNGDIGNIGDISIFSPRKLLGLKYGGVLKINNKNKSKLEILDVSNSNVKRKNLLIQSLKEKVKFFIKRRPKYENPNEFEEDYIKHLKLNQSGIKLINQVDWTTFKDSRINKYNLWSDFVSKNNLIPFFKDYSLDTIPLFFVARCKDENELIRWLKWGWKNEIKLTTWPTLPSDLRNNKRIISLWNTLICFPLDISKRKIKKLKFTF